MLEHMGVSSQHFILIYSFQICFCGPVFHEVLAYCNWRPEKNKKQKNKLILYFWSEKVSTELIKCETCCKIFCQLNDMKYVFINKNID